MPNSRQLLKATGTMGDAQDQDLVLTENPEEMGSDAQLNSMQNGWQVPDLRTQGQDHAQKSRG